MTTLLTEVQTSDKMVKIAREQVDAFSSGDWERVRAGLASNSRYDELGTERKIDGPEKIMELFKGWKQAFPDAAGTVTSAFIVRIAELSHRTGDASGPVARRELRLWGADGQDKRQPC